MIKNSMIEYMKRDTNDELYTPEYAIKPLLKYLNKDMVVWECTDYGNSNITNYLRKNGFKVISTGIKEIDFLQDKANFDFDIIITNPPYSLKDDFIERCYEYNKPFCLLLPITSLEGIRRGDMFRKHGIELLVLDKRCNFIYKNAQRNNWFNTSWFCWKVLDKQLIFEKLDKEGE